MIIGIVFSVFFTSYGLTYFVRKYALENQILEVPNERSSHIVPTPSGGGIAIVTAWLIGAMLLAVLDYIDTNVLLALIPPSILLAVIGFVDDRMDLSPWVRLATQIFSAVWFILISGSSVVTGITFLDSVPAISIGLAIFGLVWLINLFNFMDGIDGLAGVEAIFAALGLALFCWLSGAADLAAVSTLLAAACSGFLVWNWPPARIFMGDTGSSWIGFLLGTSALASAERTATIFWPAVILLGIFLVDATVTLIRRLLSGQTWYRPHRSHAYQKLSQRWGEHRRVTVIACWVNIVWLFPLAIAAFFLPVYSTLLALVALVPLTALALFLDAGK